jgi:MFS family permease
MNEPASEWDERLLFGKSGRVSIALALGSVSTELGRQLLPPLLPTIITDLGISPARAGFALTVMWICFSLFQYPAGRAADRLSSKTVLVAGGVVMMAGLTLLVIAEVYLTFVVATATLGIGVGLFIVPMRVLLSDLFVERRGQAFGLNTAAAMGGGALAAGLAILALRYFSWQVSFLPVIGVVTIVIAFVHYFGHESYVVTGVEFNLRETVTRVFGTRRIRWLVISYTLVIFTWQSVFSFVPTFLQTTKGFPSKLASMGFAMLFLVGMVVMPIAGRLSDRAGSRVRVALGSVLLCMLGLAVTIFAAGTVLILVGLLTFAAGLLAYPPVMQAHLMDLFPTSNMGGDFGAFRTFYFGISSLGPTYVGLVAEFAGYAEAYGGLLVCLLASGGILVRSARVAD